MTAFNKDAHGVWIMRDDESMRDQHYREEAEQQVVVMREHPQLANPGGCGCTADSMCDKHQMEADHEAEQKWLDSPEYAMHEQVQSQRTDY